MPSTLLALALAAATLSPGDPAPDFEATSDEGKAVKLSDFAGQKLVLYFYPKDNTSG